jgi:hypothetical protein
VSENFESRSGAPWQRTALFTAAGSIPSITLPVEPLGAERYPEINLLDFRIEKRFSLPNRHRLSVRMNVYNATNANTVRTAVSQSGPLFGVPTLVLYPRLVEFGASVDF